VRPVPTKGLVDIHDELAKLRTLAATPLPGRPAGESREVERRLQDVLVSVGDLASRQEIKRKAVLEVPSQWLKTSAAVRIRIEFDGGGEERDLNALTVRLMGNRKLERLSLHLDLELKGKS
jgi:hypothetical protein